MPLLESTLLYYSWKFMLIVGIKEPSRSIGPWAMLEDVEEPKDNQTII